MSFNIEISPTVVVGNDQPLLIIAGPCQIESLEHSLKIADYLQKNLSDLPINLVYKSSFDKANRTSLSGKRGPGIEEGLKILDQVKQETSLPLLTDVHSPEQASLAAEVVDILQTPAFLCRQTDLLIAVGQTGKAINVKKGQFLQPEDMRYAIEKVTSTGNSKVLLCERGTTFGYRDLIVDMRSLVSMRELGYPVIFDATHSVQSMGGLSGASGGNPAFVPPLSRAAAAVGIDGLFIECHQDPSSAPSDGNSMLPLELVRGVVEKVCQIRSVL
ncbi:MAG: 3-deoxy-8-phosphooctulonate synthase [Bdellovibrionales bacterium]|nr:3-deoxy-8-phosphooctulonate synthase [Bdellovibrionales bacterium]